MQNFQCPGGVSGGDPGDNKLTPNCHREETWSSSSSSFCQHKQEAFVPPLHFTNKIHMCADAWWSSVSVEMEIVINCLCDSLVLANVNLSKRIECRGDRDVCMSSLAGTRRTEIQISEIPVPFVLRRISPLATHHRGHIIMSLLT